MSLDVSLYREKIVSYDKGLTFVQENECLYDSNITHNLNTMAEKAGIYKALWRPYQLDSRYNKEDFENPRDHQKEYEFENSCVIVASRIIPLLEKGLKKLRSKPKYFEKFNSSNGWGLYEHFVPFVEEYLESCKKYPEAIVKVSR